MKLLQLIITIILTFALLFLVSAGLGIEWVAAELARRIVVWVLMLILFVVGLLVAKEILKN